METLDIPTTPCPVNPLFVAIKNKRHIPALLIIIPRYSKDWMSLFAASPNLVNGPQETLETVKIKTSMTKVVVEAHGYIFILGIVTVGGMEID